MDTAGAARAFLSAAQYGGEVLAGPWVGAMWGEPSALPRMTVGDVAGHLYLVVRRVDKHLDEPLNEAPTSAAAMSYPRVDRPEDLDLNVHEQVRHDGRHVAGWGWLQLRQAYDDRVAKLERRLLGTIPDAITLGDHSIDFGDYLGSRVVEVLVHADDIATSTGAALGDPPTAAMEAALTYLLSAARHVHGDRAVLLAFTRRERVPAGVPSIY
jgi:Mycothiol maleylpyruvate isomerase N-terminal domain